MGRRKQKGDEIWYEWNHKGGFHIYADLSTNEQFEESLWLIEQMKKIEKTNSLARYELKYLREEGIVDAFRNMRDEEDFELNKFKNLFRWKKMKRNIRETFQRIQRARKILGNTHYGIWPESVEPMMARIDACIGGLPWGKL